MTHTQKKKTGSTKNEHKGGQIRVDKRVGEAWCRATEEKRGAVGASSPDVCLKRGKRARSHRFNLH
jgi:hypothetical protein